MHLNSINVDCMSITELEALHKANAKRPTQVPLSALRTATQYFQAKDGVCRGDIVQSLCTSFSRAPETTLRGLCGEPPVPRHPATPPPRHPATPTPPPPLSPIGAGVPLRELPRRGAHQRRRRGAQRAQQAGGRHAGPPAGDRARRGHARRRRAAAASGRAAQSNGHGP